MFEKLKSKSVLLSWGFSYFIFILITIFIIAALYLATVNTIRKEITISNDLILNNMQNQIDSMIKSTKLLSNEIALNKSVNRLQNMSGSYDTVNSYSVYEACIALRNYYMVNPAIRSIYIYYKKNGIVLSNNSASDMPSFYKIYFQDSDIPYESLSNIFARKYETPHFMMVPENQNYVFNITSYPFLATNDNYMTVVLELNKDKFFVQMDESTKLNSSSFFMLSNENQMLSLSQNSNRALNDISYADLSWKSNYMVRKINNSNIVFAYTPSNEAAWKYVVAMPEKIFWQRSTDLFKYTGIGILAAVIIGSIAMCLSLRYNYHPVHVLLQSLEDKYGYHFNKNLNEYNFIKSSMDNVATEHEENKLQLENQNKALNSAILARLIKGNTTQFSNMKDVLFHSKLDIDFANYTLILFYIEDFENINVNMSSQENLKILKEYSLAQFVLNNVAGEIISSKAKCISTEVDNIMVYVVNIETAFLSSASDDLIAAADRIKSFINKNFDFEITYAVSKPYHDISTISDCFYEALEIIEYKHVVDSDSNLSDQDINSAEFYYPAQKEYQLMQAVRSCDYDNVRQIIEDLFKQNINTGKSFLELHFCVMLSIISTLIKTVLSLKNINSLDMLSELEITKRVKHSSTLPTIKAETLYIAQYIVNAIHEINSRANNSHDAALVNEITRYVENNYKLESLSVTNIAEAMSQNAAQMSKLFRNTMAEALTDYISKLRVERAKLIMKDGYNNLEELALQVGFCNTKTLTRAFKKYVGMSPGCYKSTIN